MRIIPVGPHRLTDVSVLDELLDDRLREMFLVLDPVDIAFALSDDHDLTQVTAGILQQNGVRPRQATDIAEVDLKKAGFFPKSVIFCPLNLRLKKKGHAPCFSFVSS